MPLAIGAGRLTVGLVFLVKPIESVRFLGVDSATAARLDWLARMTAARDAALGAGTVATALIGRGSSPWLVAGAACDAVDATVIGIAATQKRVATLPAAAVIGAAVAATAVALASIARAPRRVQASR